MTHRCRNQFTEKFSFVLLLCVVLFSGCDVVREILTQDDDEQPVPDTAAIAIESIAAPEEVHAGARGIELVATVVSDANADNDALNYTWEGPGWFAWEKATATWDAPIDMGVATVALTVDDGTNGAVTSTADINIIHALIIPGLEAAGIRLGDGFDRVTMLHGEPDDLDDIGFFSYWLSGKGLSGFLDGIGLVDGLFIAEPNTSRTAGGNGIGSHVSSVENELGAAGEIDKDENEGTEEHWYWESGINFDYDADSNVDGIFVFKPIGVFNVNGAQYRQTTPPKDQIRNNKAKLKALGNQ